MYSYALAGEWQDVIHALVLTENDGIEPVAENVVGDGGRAIGILQQHPAFFAEYYGKHPRWPANVQDTWPTAQILAAASFLEKWRELGRDLLITAYNQGVVGATRTVNPARNPEYVTRFGLMMIKIKGEWPK